MRRRREGKKSPKSPVVSSVSTRMRQPGSKDRVRERETKNVVFPLLPIPGRMYRQSRAFLSISRLLLLFSHLPVTAKIMISPEDVSLFSSPNTHSSSPAFNLGSTSLTDTCTHRASLMQPFAHERNSSPNLVG